MPKIMISRIGRIIANSTRLWPRVRRRFRAGRGIRAACNRWMISVNIVASAFPPPFPGLLRQPGEDAGVDRFKNFGQSGAAGRIEIISTALRVIRFQTAWIGIRIAVIADGGDIPE
jgi:hypothetical protein